MAVRTLSWGIIGCGAVCEKKGGPPLYGVEGCSLRAVTRRNREAGEDYARRHGVPLYYPAVEELLADEAIDAIYVATPPECHEEHTLLAAEAGKQVLCEKPMASDAAACQRMIDACRDAGVLLAVAYYRRCYPTILRARELIDGGAVGEVTRVWINDEFPLSHRLDLVHFLCGDIEAVWSQVETLPPGSHAAEGPVLHARAVGGAEGVMNIGWHELLVPEVVDIRCTEGRILVADLKGGKLVVQRGGKRTREDLPQLPTTHWGLVENFLAHVNGTAPLACDGVEGRKSTVILDIVESLKSGSAEVKVRY